MKISKNDSSLNLQTNENKVQKHEEHSENHREVQKSLYEKGSPMIMGQYYNPSFGSAAVTKAVKNINPKNELQKFNDLVSNVSKHIKTVITENMGEWEKQEKRAEMLVNMGFNNENAQGCARYFSNNDEGFTTYVALLKSDVDSMSAKELIRPEKMESFKNLLSKGDTVKEAQYYSFVDDVHQKFAREIAKNNVSAENAVNAVKYVHDEDELAAFTKKYIDLTKKTGFNEFNRALANLPDETYTKAHKMIDAGIKPDSISSERWLLSSDKFDDVKDVASSIIKLGGYERGDNILARVSKHLEKRPEFDPKDFAKYISSIKRDKMVKLEPAFEKYSESDWLKFTDFHYRLGTKDFDKETLKFPKDLTNFLSTHYLDGRGITSLFKVYPSTTREIGEMPSKWGVNTDKAKKQIYDAIDSFRETRDLNALSKELTNATGKKTKVTELSSGAFGTGYRVQMDGSEDTCLKIFHPEPKMQKQIQNGSRVINIDLHRHGAQVEPQAGLYVNENVEGYVKMYFGKIAPNNEKDGFYVTQYLDEKIKPIDVPDPSRKIKNSDIVYGDMKPDNVIHGKIIDYGGIRVLNSDGEFSHWKVGNLLNE